MSKIFSLDSSELILNPKLELFIYLCETIKSLLKTPSAFFFMCAKIVQNEDNTKLMQVHLSER